MKPSQFLSEEALVQRAIEVLLETLGPVETIRFLALPVEEKNRVRQTPSGMASPA